MIFGKNLEVLRKAKGLTLKELSKKTKIPASSLSKFEAQDSVPKIDVLLQLCSALECSPNQILVGESDAQYDLITMECTQIIHSMNNAEKQLVFLMLDGFKFKINELKKMKKIPTVF